MPIFTLEKVESILGRIDFYYLVVDGHNQYEDFAAQIENEGNLLSELVKLQSRMQEMAEMRQPMPASKCRDITPKGDSVKEYELKTKHLRLYLIHEQSKGRILVLLGKKTNQPRDIKAFRNIKGRYLNSKMK